MSIYKQCDIRGVYKRDLGDEHAVRLGWAIAGMLGQRRILVGGDGRVSTPALKGALIDSLLACGCDVVDIGVAPTPAFYFARGLLGIESGVMVTASHNPAKDNGFKLIFGAMPITPQEMSRLAGLMETLAAPPARGSGSYASYDVLPEYVAYARGKAPRLDGLRVAVDCANGMASLVARPIWQASGAEAIYLFDRVDGNFPNHPPNPAALENLKPLQELVRAQKFDLGVAYDGDSDRVAFVDERGEPLPNDKAIVLFAREALKDGQQVIVYDQKCSRIVPDAVRALGGTPVMELSGHTFIKSTFLRMQAGYAGELSGHHFFRELGGDDGVIASLYFSRILKASGQALSSLVAAIPTYPITPDIRLSMDEGSIRSILEKLEGELKDEATIVKTDGLRFEFADGWGLVRPSVTEPIITLRFEGQNLGALERIVCLFERHAPELKGRLLSS